MEKAKTSPIPEGFHTVTPYLIVKGASNLIRFTQKAFEAREISRMTNPDGTIMHAQLQIGNSMVMLSEASPQFPAAACMLHLYVDDCDTVYKKALEAGAVSLREPVNEYYGDRAAGVMDASGVQWWIATHVEDVPETEIERRASEKN